MRRDGFRWRTDEWVRPYLRKYGRALALTIFLGVVASGFACALMFTSGYMISLAAALPLTVLALHVPSLFVRIFGIGKPILRYGEKLTSHDWVLRMTSEMRRKLYRVLDSRMAAGAQDATTLGSVLALLNDDIGHVQNLIMRSILPLVSTWVLAVVVVAACGLLSWQLAGIMLATLVLLAVVAPLLSAAANTARTSAAKAAQASIYEGLADDVLGITDWILSGRREEYLHRLDEQLRARQRARHAAARFERWVALASQVLFCACIVGVLAWAAAVFGDAQPLEGPLGAIARSGSENAPAYSPNWIAAFVLCLFPLLEALAPLPRAAMGLTEQKDALERLNSLSRERGLSERLGMPRHVAPKDMQIELENVTFAYPGGEPVLRGLSLSVAPGTTVAITGRSGAGKTTLMKLIQGTLQPTGGSIAIGGADPATMPDAWRAIGVLHQRPKLFALTLRDNLALANPDASDADMLAALEAVGLRARFDKLPRGLDSLVAENAFNFSGGEAHRIALARILLADQPIVILDEPFAALDAATERATLAAVLQALRGRTVIAVTHNPATAAAFDRTVAL